MRYGDICSGISAPTRAVREAGLAWKAVFYSEIEANPRRVLQHHYPETPLHGDFTTIERQTYGTIDVLIGGTPCQSFSVAGKRLGLDDPRGNLALEYIRLGRRLDARWLVFENVPGLLSSEGGNDFAAFISALTGFEYAPPADGWKSAGIAAGRAGHHGIAWRILDAQYFGVAQRRRRLFVIGYIGNWRPAAAVLFEPESLRGDPAPRRKAGQGTAGFTASSFAEYREGCGTLRREGGDLGGGSETLAVHIPPCANPLTARMHKGVNTTLDEGQTLVAHTLRGRGFDASEDGTGRGVPLVPVAPAFAIQERAVCENPDAGPNGAGFRNDDAAYTLEARQTPQAVAYGQIDFSYRKPLEGESSEDYWARMLAHETAHGITPEMLANGAKWESPVAYGISGQVNAAEEIMPTMMTPSASGGGHPPAVAFGWNKSASQTMRCDTETTDAIQAASSSQPAVAVFDPNQVTCPTNQSRNVPDLCHTLPATGNSPVAYPLDLRNAGRDPEKHDAQNRQGCGVGSADDPAGTLSAAFVPGVAAFAQNQLGEVRESDVSGTINTNSNASGRNTPMMRQGMAVRRLTPRECERLQGFPDDFTLVPCGKKMMADGPRYKMLGNSMAVPVVAWILKRLDFMDGVMRGQA